MYHDEPPAPIPDRVEESSSSNSAPAFADRLKSAVSGAFSRLAAFGASAPRTADQSAAARAVRVYADAPAAVATVAPVAEPIAIGHASSLDNTKRRARNGRGSQKWGELTIFRLPASGLYFARNTVRSTIPGESDVVKDYPPATPRALVQAVTTSRKLNAKSPEQERAHIPRFVAAAIENAAKTDSVFRTGIADAVTVEQYGDPKPKAGSSVIVLPRTGERAIRFCGRLLSSAAPRALNATRNTVALTSLYLLDDGKYAVAMKLAGPEAPHASGAQAHVGIDEDGVLAALRFRGGYTRVARRVLRLAVASHPPLADRISRERVDELPSPERLLRDGESLTKFQGEMLARNSDAGRTTILYRSTESDGGYIVGVEQGVAGDRAFTVTRYVDAEQVVAAIRDRPVLLAAAAAKDKAIAALGRDVATPSPAVVPA